MLISGAFLALEETIDELGQILAGLGRSRGRFGQLWALQARLGASGNGDVGRSVGRCPRLEVMSSTPLPRQDDDPDPPFGLLDLVRKADPEGSGPTSGVTITELASASISQDFKAGVAGI
jgi:hypothetical protein